MGVRSSCIFSGFWRRIARTVRGIRAIRGYSLPEKHCSVIKNFGIDKFLGECILDGNVDDLGPAKRCHETELLLPNQLNGLDSETCRQNPIICGWRAASLNVA